MRYGETENGHDAKSHQYSYPHQKKEEDLLKKPVGKTLTQLIELNLPSLFALISNFSSLSRAGIAQLVVCWTHCPA